MNRTPEREVKDEVDKILKELKVWYYKPVSRGYGKHGIPDYLICMHGMFISIETKREGKDPDALQEDQIKEILANGGINFVVKPSTLKQFEMEIRRLHGQRAHQRST